MPLKAMNHIENDEAVRYIKKYFEPRNNGRPLFTGSHFDSFDGGGGVEPNRITAADLLALEMLSESVRGQAALGIVESLADEIEELLVQVPEEAKLEEITEAEFERLLDKGSPAQQLWDLLKQNNGSRWHIGTTRASKILARKRPHLIPIYDTVVRREALGERSGNYWRDWFNAFQGAEGRQLAERLRSIRNESGETHLSLLRVLDIVLWMKGTGYAKVTETAGDEE
ncbi:DUF6308 family protein [Microbacterium sp. A93]|uniref:DUF6308 family protein n=1 Tax=Microbacterium sp. A93 TaxID=3450716 RepID=UPI003F42AB92